MSGIYFHIPFCKTKCRYCDFYSTTNFKEIEEFFGVLKAELWLRRNFLNDINIETIYFGGGTPSLLKTNSIKDLLQAVYSVFKVEKEAEITFESNPDDLLDNYLYELKETGINRLSIGIQSFHDRDLLFLGRRHNSRQAVEVVKKAQEAGFDNISIDLIYGIPGLSLSNWKENLNRAFELGIQHLSAYHLTYHKNTQLWNELKNEKFIETDERESIKQFNILLGLAEQNGFEFYEISNFAKKGKHSKHNTAYWNQVEYLGIGPSAHSYNTNSRYWNCSDISEYKEKITRGILPGESENLGLKEQMNDYILTRLRTKWGIDMTYLSKTFGEKIPRQLLILAEPYIKSGRIIKEGAMLRLSPAGFLISDKIISDLIFTE